MESSLHLDISLMYGRDGINGKEEKEYHCSCKTMHEISGNWSGLPWTEVYETAWKVFRMDSTDYSAWDWPLQWNSNIRIRQVVDVLCQGKEDKKYLRNFLNKIVNQIEEYDGENWLDKQPERSE